LLESSKMGHINQSKLESWKMGPIICPETSKLSYQYMLLNISQESSSLLSTYLELSYFKRILTLVKKIGYWLRHVCMSVCLSE